VNAGDVPAGPLIVDTDVFSIWCRKSGRHDDFRSLAEGHELAMSFASVGEALAPTHSPRVSAELAGRIRRALRQFVVLPFDAGVVERWAEIANLLRDAMKGKGVNDLWTAACALSYGLPLMTNHLGDFQKVSAAFPGVLLVHPDL
jgi:predicted nucleic acid-binding protein